MRKRFFKNVTTLEELKREYRKLCFVYHPDRNPDNPNALEQMKLLNNEYDELFKQLQHQQAHRAKAEGREQTKKEQAEQRETPETTRQIIAELMKYKNITIEILGTWLWLSGETYPIKDQIKALGFRWSKPKKLWYLDPAADPENQDTKKKYHRSTNQDKLREKYTSTIIQTERADKKKPQKKLL